MNPYESPTKSTQSRQESEPAKPCRLLSTSAAIVSGLSIYIPIVGLRGAAFCLFPGIAQRSMAMAAKGTALGFLADIAFCMGWFFFGPVWEPRDSYNEILVTYLPPGQMVMTHAGCPIPNGLQFGLGLVLWTTLMFNIWIQTWKPRINGSARRAALFAGAIAVSVAASVLWIVAPMDDWWQHGAAPFGDLAPLPFTVVFVVSLPACTLIVGKLISAASSPQRIA